MTLLQVTNYGSLSTGDRAADIRQTAGSKIQDGGKEDFTPVAAENTFSGK